MGQKRKIKKTKIITAVISILCLVGVLFFLFSDGNNIRLFQSLFKKDITKEEVRETAQGFGLKGRISIVFLSMLQVVLTFLPAEPVQVVAGIASGFWRGVLLCGIGVALGNTVIFLFYKIFGDKIRDFYETNVKIDFSSAKTFAGVSVLVFVLYFLPAIPYGLICFFAASTNMKFPRYIILTTLGALPSVMIGVGLGDIAIASSFIWSIVIFVLLVALLLIALKKKDVLIKKLTSFFDTLSTPYTSQTTVRKPNKLLANVSVFAFRIYTFFTFRFKKKSRVETISSPSIVIYNHGSFIDFLYGSSMLLKYKPHFVAGRAYFYKKSLGSLMKKAGIIPKSMFTMDLESAKNCLSVLKNGETLVIAPEARLSTVGKYEGVQEATMKFLYKAGVPIYVIKYGGNYLAYPKWSKKPQKGAPVEAELYKLYSEEDLAATDYETFKNTVNSALTYNEFSWLDAHPSVRYKTKRIAEGLEGILYRCPNCKEKYTLKTKGNTITCSNCSLTAKINDRYGFENDFPFKNFQDWYSSQADEIFSAVEENENYSLESDVELYLSSIGGKTSMRKAGNGHCKLDKTGLTYVGTIDGEQTEKHFNENKLYRLLFGANEDFELYEGKELFYFVPTEKKSSVEWYLTSCALGKYFKA